ncbi:hypothetical protein WMY93_014014 [Mugilogobius chulae]|uniref:Meiosis 1 arrest protein n=1 Tax=Mugilogobius chulae TaxID=88201 RepID=A0AAW0NXK0_9GOBI
MSEVRGGLGNMDKNKRTDCCNSRKSSASERVFMGGGCIGGRAVRAGRDLPARAETPQAGKKYTHAPLGVQGSRTVRSLQGLNAPNLGSQDRPSLLQTLLPAGPSLTFSFSVCLSQMDKKRVSGPSQPPMDKKRASGPSQPPLNPVTGWSFPRQPARVLVVEAFPPWWSSTRRSLCEALENVLCLASSLDGPCRIPLLSVYAVSRQQECLLPFPVRGNLLRLHSCVEELRSLPGDGCVRSAQTGAHLMGQAVLDSLQQHKQYQRHTSNSNSSSNQTSVEVTVVTSQPGRSTLRQLELKLKEADLVSLKRLLLVQVLQSSANYSQDSPPAEETNTETTEGTDTH